MHRRVVQHEHRRAGQGRQQGLNTLDHKRRRDLLQRLEVVQVALPGQKAQHIEAA